MGFVTPDGWQGGSMRGSPIQPRGPRVAPTLTHPLKRDGLVRMQIVSGRSPQRPSSPGLPAELHDIPTKGCRSSDGPGAGGEMSLAGAPLCFCHRFLPPLARLGEFFCEGPAWEGPSSFSHSQRNKAVYRGDGLAFEPPGEPSGLRSTACPVPLACSSMLRVLPGLAAPLVVGDVGLVELPIAGLPEGLVP